MKRYQRGRRRRQIAGQGVRTCLGSNRRTAAPGLAAAVENVQVCKEVVAMATSDSKEGESTFTCSLPSVMESPKQVNTLDVQAQVAAESCSSVEAAVRHARSQEGNAAGCEEDMKSAETACCVAMEVAEEVLREKPNPPAAAAMAQDIENNITRVLAVMQPWKEVCDNQKRFHEMEENELKRGNVKPFCADSQAPETVSVPSTSGHTNGNINAISVAGVSVPSALSVPGVSLQCDKATGSTNMAAPLTNKTDRKRLFRQNVSEVDESQTSRRKNEVKIKWVKERDKFPERRFVARNLIKESLGFTPADVFGLLSVTDTEFDMSFKLSQGLGSRGARITPGKDRDVCYHPGPPRVCFRCGSNRHFAAKCPVVKCALCGETGNPIHAHRSCPDAWHNIVRDCPNLQEGFGQGMEIVEEGAQTSEVEDIEIDLDGEESTPKFQVKRRGEESDGARQKQNRI
ncbi:hypothetical protein XELAEV_18012836mg [Xenopus laevis]|uniref:CCHC-type domain-containing protein n=1 Tax=Xenopus laevis TaxID=8355 RepID=A0A974DNV4_XENLA|nr:hypothetical protein XELAEV_18012836mg [Xenopus laevis]